MLSYVCVCHLEDDARLFQQILRGYGTTDPTTGRKEHRANNQDKATQK